MMIGADPKRRGRQQVHHGISSPIISEKLAVPIPPKPASLPLMMRDQWEIANAALTEIRREHCTVVGVNCDPTVDVDVCNGQWGVVMRNAVRR